MLQLKLAGFDSALGSYEGELAGHEVKVCLDVGFEPSLTTAPRGS